MPWSGSTRYCPAAVAKPARRVPGGRPPRPAPRGIPGGRLPRSALLTRTAHVAAQRRSMSLIIGVDVGGTKIAAGVVDEKGSIIEMVKRRTPAANASATIDVLSDAVNE